MMEKENILRLFIGLLFYHDFSIRKYSHRRYYNLYLYLYIFHYVCSFNCYHSVAAIVAEKFIRFKTHYVSNYFEAIIKLYYALSKLCY